MTSLRRLLPYLRPMLGAMGVAYGAMILLSLTEVIYAALAGPGLEFIFAGEVRSVLRAPSGELRSFWTLFPEGTVARIEALSPDRALLFLPALVVAVALAKGVAQTLQFFLFGRISQRVLLELRRRAFAAMLGQSPSFFARRAHGDLLSRLSSDTLLVEQAFFNGLGSLLRDSLTVVALLGYVFYSDPMLALVTFVTVPLAVFPLNRLTKRLKRVSKHGQVAAAEINAISYEALAGVRVVQAFGAEAHEMRRLDGAAQRYAKQMLVSYFIRAVRTPIMEVLGAIALAALIGTLGWLARAHTADSAHYVSFILAIFLMYDPLKKLGKVSDFLAAGEAAADRIFEIVDLPAQIRDAPGALEMPRFARAVRFEGAGFTYDGATRVLDGIDLEIAAGNVVALVGKSGSGKTTLANLLPRFYDVTEGRLTIDDCDVRDVSLASLRRQIGMVSQDTFLFNASIAENIAYALPGAPTEAIRRAATAAYAEEFIAKLPNGYDTVIGERGVTLSGGQRQRLAIARALLRDAPLLVLDEATSSLDLESERYVQEALERLMEGRTSLVIAHRLSTVRRADLICVLAGGRIVERGRHSDLLARGGEYARLYELQFQDEVAPAS